MYKVLTTAAAIAVLGVAATGVAQARGDNFDRGGHSDQGYAGPAYSQAPQWPWYVPSHGIVGESCGDAFQPICNSERPYD